MRVSRRVNSNIAFLGLGSNLGDKLKNIKTSLELISSHEEITILSVSSIYKTPPVGFEEQDFFLNAVIKISTNLSPFELLKFIQLIEKKLGRKRIFKWGPRTIDIDILVYNDWIINRNNLQVPHPLMHERGFVLIPFNEIESSLIHPTLNMSIATLLSNLNLNDVRGIEMFVDAKNLTSL